MANTSAVYARIDTNLKENAEGIHSRLGIIVETDGENTRRGSGNPHVYIFQGTARGSRVQNREMESENCGIYNLPPR